MSKVQLSGNVSGTGIFTIASPNSNTDRTLTLPDNTGTVLTSASSITQNAGPAFNAYRDSSDQSYSPNTWTKVQLNAETFDTANCFDSTTNYRFTPNVAGYYQINGGVHLYGTSITFFAMELRVSGNETIVGPHFAVPSQTDIYEITNSLFYLNGSTDYVELWAYSNGSNLVIPYGTSTSFRVWMNGALVRAA